MDKLDRRVVRTHELLGNALMELIVEKGYEAITIKDVTERADVAYVTFFRHYRDLDELLIQRLEAGIAALIAGIESAMQNTPGMTLFGEVEGRFIFEHVQQNASLYRILLNSRGAAHIRKQVKNTIAQKILNECPPMQTNSAGLPPELVADHLASAQLSLIDWWLDHDMPYSVERMAQIYDQLVATATMQAAGFGYEGVPA